MKMKTCIAMLMCFTVSTQAFADIKIIKKTAANTRANNHQFRFNGQLIGLQNAAAIPRIAARKSIVDGVTREVLPYDGSTVGAVKSLGNSSSETSDGMICNTVPVELKAGFSEFNLLDPNAVEIWPGRLVKISSIDEGAYTTFNPVNTRRNLDIALIAAGTAQASMVSTIPANQISQGQVVDAVNILKGRFGNNDFGSDSWMFDQTEFFNTKQFLIEAGAGVNASPINLELRANAGASSTEKKNSIVLKFAREAYDVKVDSDIGEILNDTNISTDAGVVSSVTYGQIGIVQIQSDASLSQIHAALDFSFNVDPSVAISGNARTELEETLRSFSVKGIFKGVQGNSSIDPGAISSVDDLKNILSGNSAFTQTTPVVPLSFTVKSLKDGSTMMLKSTLSYNQRECLPLAQDPNQPVKLKIKLLALTVPRVNDGFSDDEDIFGKISVRTNANRSGNLTTTSLWSKNRANNVKVKQSTLPSDPGAYSMAGVSTDLEVVSLGDAAVMRGKFLELIVELKDDEVNNPVYERRALRIPFSSLLRSISANATTTLDNFDSTNKAFFVDVVEVGNTNKVRVWFKASAVE
jgi:hypothetical protein